jgi:hypothetical protein
MSTTLEAWMNHNDRDRIRSRGITRVYDTIDFPDVMVTEEPATDDSMRRYLAAEQGKALELVP